MFFAHTTTATATLLFSLLFLGGVALSSNELRILNASELINFSKSVNNGNSYSGTTVYLDSDIVFGSSLSQQFEPIGNIENYLEENPFKGTFDGQGHTISELGLNSSLQHVGLFGYSDGATIKNVVLDETCLFNPNSPKNHVIFGSISGYCGSCIIEGVVNMANIIFVGNTIKLDIGGLIGISSFSNIIRNCVNYGSLINSGIINGTGYIGGIAGTLSGSRIKFIQNCANYGTITHNGTTATLGIGGISGYFSTGSINIENCVSAGQVVNSKQGSWNNCYIGSIVGEINSGVTGVSITHCFWTSDVGHTNYVGTGSGTISDSYQITSLNVTTLGELNEYVSKNNTWDNWFMLHINGGKINELTQEALIVTQKHFSDPEKEGNTFLFWCKDRDCDERYDLNTTNITEVTDLYAAWNTSTLTFDFNNGAENEVRVLNYNETIIYPENTTKKGHTFNGWSPKPDRMPAKDVTVTAQWTINNYTIIFVFNNGAENEVRSLNFDETIVYPENPTKEGHTFNGWSPKPERMGGHDITITAQWIEKSSEFVGIVFDRKEMKEKEAEEIIKEYMDEGFTIEKIETDKDTGGIRVIVKFSDRRVAENFVEIIRASSNKRINIISVGYVFEEIGSLSSFCYPTLYYSAFI